MAGRIVLTFELREGEKPSDYATLANGSEEDFLRMMEQLSEHQLERVDVNSINVFAR